MQGLGNTPDAVGVRIGSNSELSNVTIIVTGNGSKAVVANGTSGLLHDCFIRNSATQPSTNPHFAIFLDRSTNWELYRNTIIGGHSGVSASPQGNTPYSSAHSIHHNLIFGTKRIHGFKAPHGIVLYAASDNLIFENTIITEDARGINVQMYSDGNEIYNNLVDARYTTTVSSDTPGYAENNIYAYWQRHGSRNYLHNNRFIASNFTTEITASTDCFLLGNGDDGTELLGENRLENNTLISFPNEIAAKYASGISISKGSSLVSIKNNEIYSNTKAIYVEDSLTTGTVILNNALFNVPSNWVAFLGSRIPFCNISGNQTVTLTAHNTTPSIPNNLMYKNRFNAIELSWSPNTEAFVRGYYVYRNGSKLKFWITGGTYFVDLSPLTNSDSYYYITAVSFDGKESAPSNKVYVSADSINKTPKMPQQLKVRTGN